MRGIWRSQVVALLLFSSCIAAGLVTLAHGQPLDSPLHSYASAKAGQSMNASPVANSGAATKKSAEMMTCIQLGCDIGCVPAVSTPGEVVCILTLIGVGCWAILRRRRGELS
jgi:hypothetical protein